MDWPSIEYYYYLLNNIWIDGNVIMILPFVISCIYRFRKPDINRHLVTDHLARIFLLFTCIFYAFDMVVKYQVDGGDSICQKAFFIHHLGSLFIIPPLIFNDYIPWWACPIGFLHGFCIYYPEFEPLNYIYASALFVFHYGIYQHPYSKLKGYWITRYAINFVWIFALLLLLGDCSNFLARGPD